MKAKQIIIIAAMVLAAIAPLRAQEWERNNDSVYVRRTQLSQGVMTEYAEPVDLAALTAKINNDLRSAALCQAGALGCEVVALAATAGSAIAYNGQSPTLKGAAIVFGLAGIGLYIAGIDKMGQRKVYLGPDGVVLRITRTEAPKYDNKKLRSK